MNFCRVHPLCGLATLIVALLTSACDGGGSSGGPAAGEWSQWRGPNGSGVSPLADLPVAWGPDSSNLKWRIEPTAGGDSQPIVSRGRIYLTGARGIGKGAVERTVAAYAVEDGALLWETVISQRRGERTHHRFGSFATPTPVTDGETVWAYFGGYLAALTREGELLWREVVDEKYWTNSRYGAASSPVLAGDAVVVFGDEEWGDVGKRRGVSWLAAYDQRSGEELWRNEWDGTCCSYSTPLVRQRGDGLEVIVATTPLLLGFDAATGERLWQAELPIVQVVPSLVEAGGMLIQAGSVHGKRIVAYRLSGTGAATRAERVWEEARASPELASPVVYDGLLYTVTPGGVMTCFEPETGEVVWRERLTKGDYRSAILGGDGKLYLMTLGGRVEVVRAGREFELLASNDLAEITESALAVAESCLLVRTEESLYCIERGSGPEKS